MRLEHNIRAFCLVVLNRNGMAGSQGRVALFQSKYILSNPLQPAAPCAPQLWPKFGTVDRATVKKHVPGDHPTVALDSGPITTTS